MLRRCWMRTRWVMPAVLVTGMVVSTGLGTAPASAGAARGLRPTVTKALAFDRSAPLRDLVRRAHAGAYGPGASRERGPIPVDTGHSADGALQSKVGQARPLIAPPLLTF